MYRPVLFRVQHRNFVTGLRCDRSQGCCNLLQWPSAVQGPMRCCSPWADLCHERRLPTNTAMTHENLFFCHHNYFLIQSTRVLVKGNAMIGMRSSALMHLTSMTGTQSFQNGLLIISFHELVNCSQNEDILFVYLLI